MSITTETTQEYTDARSLYSESQPRLVGQFTVSRADAQSLPLALDVVYEQGLLTLSQEPTEAQIFARTFGKLSVNVALDNSPTNFELRPANAFAPPNITEMRTNVRRSLSDMFTYPDIDAPVSYVLSDAEPLTVELGLIQALHMLDYAIVSQQFDGKLPTVRLMNPEGLMQLQADNPGLPLRTYGNVRGLRDAMKLIGTIVPTALLERSPVSTASLPTALPVKLTPPKTGLPNRDKAALIGITTAKQPHIGHGLLMLKAFSEVEAGTPVVVELNDRGPRVGRAIAQLSQIYEMSSDDVLSKVTAGGFSIESIEQAYQQRGDNPPIELPADFALTASNESYQKLLDSLEPLPNSLLPLANSNPLMSELVTTLKASDAAEVLFDDSGMTLAGSPELAVPVEAAGQLTATGTVLAVAAKYALTIVDSPSLFSGPEVKALGSAGLDITTTTGKGIAIGFESASGTKGNAPLLKDLVEIVAEITGRPKLTLPVLRSFVEQTAAIRSETTSLTPNFANTEVMLNDFQACAYQFDPEACALSSLYQPLAFRSAARQIVIDYLAPIYDAVPRTGKIKAFEVTKLVELLPALEDYLSENLLIFARETDQPLSSIPRTFVTKRDAEIMNNLRSGNPKQFLKLLALSAVTNPETVLAQSYQANAAAADQPTLLGGVMRRMGYNETSLLDFVEGLQAKGDVYVVQQ